VILHARNGCKESLFPHRRCLDYPLKVENPVTELPLFIFAVHASHRQVFASEHSDWA